MRRMAVAVGLLALLGAIGCKTGDGGDGEPSPPPAYVTGSKHSLGSERAPVLLVEYADFQ